MLKSSLHNRHSCERQNPAERVRATYMPSGSKKWLSILIAFLLLFSTTACTEQEFIDSGRTAIKKSCQNARNCTVNDETAAR